MISHKYKCIFIHIPKTAGTSIEKKLGHFDQLEKGVQDHSPITEFEPIPLSNMIKSIFNANSSSTIRHLKKMIKGKVPISRSKYQQYFKFAFVRNSWSRVFSWYKNVMRDEHHQKRYGVPPSCSFRNFLNNHLDQYEIQNQLYWIKNFSGDIPMDFIGRFENLENDFSYVADILGITDKQLPRLITGSGANYINYYDEMMKKIIYERYKEEIIHFNFRFGE